MNHPAPLTAASPSKGDLGGSPTIVRYWVLAILASLSMITYLDRACFGLATQDIAKVLGLQSDADLFWALFAFTFAYSVFEIPSGWMGDVFGSHVTLVRIVIGWSIFTALTGTIGWPGGPAFLFGQSGFWLLVAIRFMFGVGEAGAYPNITRALHNWFPLTTRGSAQGLIWFSGRLMGGLTPIIWGAMTSVHFLGLEWRYAFMIFGGIGILWCVLFSWWFRNFPAEKPEVNQAELELINENRDDVGAAHGDVPWMKMLTSVNLWAICFMYFGMSFGWYFNITFLSGFLQKFHGVDKNDVVLGGIYKGGPLLLGALGCLLGGFLTDWLVVYTDDRALARRIIGFTGLALASACFFISPFMPLNNALPFVLALSFAAFFNDMTMGSAWATCQDIGKKHAAIVAGAMNTIGNLGGATANVFTGLVITMVRDANLAAQGNSHLMGEAIAATAKANAIDPADMATKAAAIDAAAALTKAATAAGNAAELPGYIINFYAFAIVYAIAALLWFRINAKEPVFDEDVETKTKSS